MQEERSYQTGSSSMCSLLHRFTRKSYLSMGSPKIFNFWGERRHKSPNVASDILCDLVAERESSSSPCKKKCEILLQKPMKKRSAVILVNWGEIVGKKRSRLMGNFSNMYIYLFHIRFRLLFK